MAEAVFTLKVTRSQLRIIEEALNFAQRLHANRFSKLLGEVRVILRTQWKRGGEITEGKGCRVQVSEYREHEGAEPIVLHDWEPEFHV